MNQMECPSPVNHSISNQPLIKTGQYATVRAGERQKITVCDVSGIKQTCCFDMFSIQQRYIIRPEGISLEIIPLSQS